MKYYLFSWRYNHQSTELNMRQSLIDRYMTHTPERAGERYKTQNFKSKKPIS
jgi:hypothetical protein